jgi:O-antigen ligase
MAQTVDRPPPATAPGPATPSDGRASRVLTFGEAPAPTQVPRWMIILGALLAQAILTRAMVAVPRLGLVQALFLVGLTGYVILRRQTTIAICVLAYIPNAEIVWRQTGAPIPYQFAPYLAIAISTLLVLTVLPTLTKPARAAMLYVALLIPSVVVTISVAGTDARELISFALSGPVALMTMIAVFSQLTFHLWFYRRLLWVIIVSGMGPLMAAVTAIDEYIAANGGIEFESESNFVTSGGFGPVQVSSMMGLTALCCVLVFLVERNLAARALAFAMGIFATVLSFLTFSRGGMTATAIALALFFLVQARNAEARRRVFTVVLVVFAIGYFVIVPRINDFTDGEFEKRFSDTSSGRSELAVNDLEVFTDNVWFGVGPGMMKYNRLGFDVCALRSDDCRMEASSHTEFTRMLGEHGMPGLLSVVLVVWLAVLAVQRAGPSRPVTVAMLGWAIAQMFYANFRVVGIAFAFAFAFARIVADPEADLDYDPDAQARPLRLQRSSRARYASENTPI